MTNKKLLHYIEIITSDLQGRYRVDGETATEAVYRAFANVWDKDYQPEAFFQYFRVSAKNELVDMFRHEKKYDFDRKVDLTEELAYQDQDAARGSEDLDRIAERLPKVYVELFELLREGIDHREIANRLNKSHGAIRTMKTRMIQYCQAVLVAMIICFALPFMAAGQDTLTVQDAQIIAPNLYQTLYDTTFVQDTTFTTVYDTTFVTDSTFVTVYDTTQVVDSVYTLVKNESPTLRNVWWQHRREPGERYNYFDIRGESTADSLVFTWSGEDIKKKTLSPDSAFTITVKTQYLGQAEYSITGYDSLWTITNTDIINTALMDTLGGLASITDIEVMALADTPYITVPWTAPASDLTDYVGYYDLADAPQSWWDEVDTSDGTKLRVAKDDAAANDTSATELAFEVIDFDDVAQTGHLWFRWSGTLPSTSPDDIRIYAPQASYTSYGVTDTFGRNAVWVDFDKVFHMNQSGAPYVNSTGGDNLDVDTATYTAPTSAAGKIGDALDFNGTTDGIGSDYNAGEHPSNQVTISAWINTNATDVGEGQRIQTHPNSGTGDNLGMMILDAAEVRTRVNGSSFNATQSYSTGTWYHFVSTVDLSSNSLNQYWDASNILSSTTSGSSFADDNQRYGVGHHPNDPPGGDFDRFFNGILDEVRQATFVQSADWISLEFANQNDPASFWGTPTFVAAGGGGTTEVSFSLNSAANVSSSSTSIAEAGISLNADADVSDGSTATGESDITISHIQQASTQSTAQAESSFSLASLLQIAFDKQSITDASFSLPTVHQVTTVSDTQEVNEASFSLALQKAISTDQISTIEVSYSLNAAQQAAMASDATGEAAMSITLQAGLSLVSTALAEAGISFDAVQSMTITGQAVGVEVTLSDGRTLTIKLQNRTFTIAQDNRTYIIPDDNRTLNIDP